MCRECCGGQRDHHRGREQPGERTHTDKPLDYMYRDFSGSPWLGGGGGALTPGIEACGNWHASRRATKPTRSAKREHGAPHAARLTATPGHTVCRHTHGESTIPRPPASHAPSHAEDTARGSLSALGRTGTAQREIRDTPARPHAQTRSSSAVVRSLALADGTWHDLARCALLLAPSDAMNVLRREERNASHPASF